MREPMTESELQDALGDTERRISEHGDLLAVAIRAGDEAASYRHRCRLRMLRALMETDRILLRLWHGVADH
jgi:hypothetical protein